MSLDGLVAEGVVERSVVLGPLTTYKFGGPARFFADVATEADLVRILAARNSEGADLPLAVLGRGSNVVVSDAGFDGLVLRLGGDFAAVAVDDDGSVTAGGAVSLPILARTAVRAGRGGLEFYVGIPGTVGGAVMMNAGCHGSDTSEWMRTARVLDAATCEATDRTPAELDLAYRHSNLGAGDIVTAATFTTLASTPAEGEARMREITQWRKERQPGGTLNAGSVFKNPESIPAGRLIDECGLKGFAVGGASVSSRHANFFVADDTATAQDVFDLVTSVRRIVAEAAGILLEPEVRFVGSFMSSNADDGGHR